MIQSHTGSATMPILIGAITEVSQIAIALMITTNRPIVENSSRPVSATRTGPRESVDQDEDRRPRGEADEAGAAERDDLGAPGPEREWLRDGDDPEEQEDDREQDGVDHHLDDETTHGASSAVVPR